MDRHDELTHLRQINTELNQANRQYRLQIANLQARLHEAQVLLQALHVRDGSYPLRDEVSITDADADPLEYLTYTA